MVTRTNYTSVIQNSAAENCGLEVKTILKVSKNEKK